MKTTVLVLDRLIAYPLLIAQKSLTVLSAAAVIFHRVFISIPDGKRNWFCIGVDSDSNATKPDFVSMFLQNYITNKIK